MDVPTLVGLQLRRATAILVEYDQVTVAKTTGTEESGGRCERGKQS